MENTTEKPNSGVNKNKPPKSAYGVLAGLFAVVFAVLYIALLLRVRFLSIAVYDISMTAANLIFALILFVLLGALYLYVVFTRRELLYNIKEAGAMLFVLTLVTTANIYIVYLDPYAMFISLSALLLLPFAKKHDAFVLNVFTCLISSFVLINAKILEVTVFTAVAGVLGGAVASYAFPTSLTRARSLLRSFVTLLSTVVIYFALLSAYNLGVKAFADNLMYIGGAAAAQLLLVCVLEPVIESLFKLTTDFKLIELTTHKAPLIHRLIVEAPGTFNHCLAVANFAEICAEAIGENPYLARACAYYHDVGKLNNPGYFTENQAGYNPHDELLPEVSADIIRQHTEDGYSLCKEYGIPDEVASITVEHHGTLPITFFYNKAKTLTDSAVNMDEYRYHGETPKGKIAAIIMICDSAEAAIRAMDNPDGEKVDKLLQGMIDERLRLGQFDDCAITIKELNAVRYAIVGAYGGLFHRRIKYNNGKKDSAHV